MVKQYLKLFLLMTIPTLIILGTGCAEKKKKVIPKSKVTIRSVPEKVNINIISHPKLGKLGATPVKGELVKGMYVFEFTKPGYKTTWRKIVCKPGSRQDLEIKMDPMTASVIVETEPTGATLKSGERQIGETPLAIHNVALGTHTYTLSKPGFSTREVSVTIEDERPKLISENMSSNIGTLIVSSTPNGNLFIDDTPRGKTPSTLQLVRGNHDIRIEVPGHSAHKETVAIGRGKTSRVNVALQELPGSIKVVTNPPNVNLMVNGKQYNNTPTTLKDLKPGEYEIVVSHENYDTSKRKVSLAAGQNLTVDVTLDTNMGGIDLIVHPPGITVYIDNKKIGVTQQGETKDISKVFEIRNLKSGVHLLTLAHKRAKPSSVKFKFEVEKGKIRRKTLKRFWVEDTYIRLNDGREEVGRIAQQNDEEVHFETKSKAGKITIKYPRTDIEIIRPLKEEE